jgi:hypothetical protein
MRLNPLHSVEWLCDMIRVTGEYFDTSRRTGRTTALALKAIAEAIENPWVWVPLKDHHNTILANESMSNIVRSMVHVMQLEHFVFRKGAIRFGKD